jgi:Na+/H+ antiporter NhaD/arsenite permease-like protein
MSLSELMMHQRYLEEGRIATVVLIPSFQWLPCLPLPMNIPLLILSLVGLLIAVRQVGSITFQIWQVMGVGALAVLFTGNISVPAAWGAVDMDVMLFLFGMFVVGHALEESGYLAHLSYKYFKRARTRDSLILMVLFGAGAASAFLMNDTLAIIGTPVVLLLARKHGMSPRLLLLALAYGITIGSAMSPIGNPQNLLIAVNGGIQNPFVTFLRWLFLPTVLNLYIAFVLLKKLHPDDFHEAELTHSQEPIRSRDLANLSRISIQIVLVLVVVKIVTAILGMAPDFRLTHIALAASLPILVGSPARWRILRHIDWHTLAFFAAMFVLMESVWETGFFQAQIGATELTITSNEAILTISVLLSQLISNVPLVALYQPMLLHAGASTAGLMALAAGSTIAGNLFILGAASNVIIIQNAERKARETITFVEFARAGIPLTLMNVAVYWIFLTFMP